MDVTLRHTTLSLDSRRVVVFAITFVVAFCSIVYELIYSELLTVIFGGTVLRYSITIGLFLFSFGIGSFLFRFVDERPSNFFRVEIILAMTGPAGLVYIILLNSFPNADVFFLQGGIPLVASHLPIVLVGVLSGLEVPFLTALIGDGNEDFPEVLGIDYFGSLSGTVVYALVLYPTLGLIPSVFALGLLNALVAIGFALRFSKSSRALFVVCLLVSGLFAGVLVYDDEVEDGLTKFYLSNQFEAEYPSGQMQIDIIDRRATRYQDITMYTRDWTGTQANWTGPMGREQCLRLDSMLQLCESWVDSYHSGLVDVPATAFENFSNANVLVLGGGDWIAINHLRKYNVSIDHVDLDREFMNYAKDNQFLQQYHDDAYRYDKLNTTVADAYSYLRNTHKQYDLIMMDLPGIRNDDLLKLYSKEFYSLLRKHLTDQGIAVTWSYSRYAFPEHYKTYMNTIRAAGFDSYIPYFAYDDLDGDGDPEKAEGFYILSPREQPTRQLHLNESENPYVQRYSNRYRQLDWQPIPQYNGVEVNSIFDPNYDIIIDF